MRGITNGVHPFTWTSAHFAKLYDEYLPGWCHEPELLVRVECCIPDEPVWYAHFAAKADLIGNIKQTTSIEFDPTVPIIGFARRMTAYKRPDLLFSNVERLRDIARKAPFQLVLSGKAHPADAGGKRLIEMLHSFKTRLAGELKLAYLPNYNMNVARLMAAGVDVWLNTPLPPLEASGTSGMKAAFNGVPNLSVPDGWWIEGCIEGITGWAIGTGQQGDPDTDAAHLYDKLQHTVLPLYYDDRPGWIGIMKGAISKNASIFNSHRMMRRYVTETYIR